MCNLLPLHSRHFSQSPPFIPANLLSPFLLISSCHSSRSSITFSTCPLSPFRPQSYIFFSSKTTKYTHFYTPPLTTSSHTPSSHSLKYNLYFIKLKLNLYKYNLYFIKHNLYFINAPANTCSLTPMYSVSPHISIPFLASAFISLPM